MAPHTLGVGRTQPGQVKCIASGHGLDVQGSRLDIIGEDPTTSRPLREQNPPGVDLTRHARCRIRNQLGADPSCLELSDRHWVSEVLSRLQQRERLNHGNARR
jgi:hypothetical protein